MTGFQFASEALPTARCSRDKRGWACDCVTSPNSLFVDHPQAGVHPSLPCNLKAHNNFGLFN